MTDLHEQIAVLEKTLQNALKAEERKWEYRKQELAYLEAGQHMRALNQLMWQVPSMAIAITGGLWYGAATLQINTPRAWAFSFIAIVDLLTIVTLWRLRERIGKYLDEQDKFAALPPSKGLPSRTVITCWTIALLTAVIFSVTGAFNTDVFKKPTVQNAPPALNGRQAPQAGGTAAPEGANTATASKTKNP